MAHVHFDNTEDETHAALVHDCEPGTCPAQETGRAAGKGRAGISQLVRGPARLVARPYKVAADDLGVRPKIRDIGWHRFRADVAALVDWLRICYREGWLGKPRRNHLKTERKFKDRATSISVKLAKMRGGMGIMGAYGEKAEQLGLGKRTPPSGRDRGAPVA